MRKNKIGFLDDNTLDYYRRVFQTITSDIDGEEKELFLDNVFSQLETEAIRVCQNQTASQFVERLLVDAKPAHIIQLLTAFSSDWTTVSTDRFASHVFQNLIALSPACMVQGGDNSDDTQEEKSVKHVIVEYFNHVSENLDTLLVDTYGSHILRVLLEVLGGVDVSTDIIRSRMSKTQSKDEREWPRKDNPPSEYNNLFRKLVKKIFSLCDYSEHLMDASASPVYQTVLLILKTCDPELCHKYVKKIIKKSGLVQHRGDKEDDKDKEVSLPPLVQNEVGSYLVEQMLSLSVDIDSQQKVYRDIFKGKLLYFGIDRIANFILQKLIDNITEKELFEEVFDELCNYTEDILAIHHIGILTKMATGCIRLHTRQEKFVKILMEAFHCATPESRQNSLAPLLLTLSTYDVYYKTDAKEESTKDEATTKAGAPLLTTINYHGSVLMQNLLRFGKTKLLVTSLLELKPVELKTLSCDRCGSHVIDVFCESESVGEKKRDLLLQRMKGLLIDIACDRNGSRTIESMWKYASVKQKIVIAEELSKHEDRLRSNNFGYFVHRNFNISMFKSRRNDWTTEQGINNKKRKLFKDFLNDSGAGSQKVARVESIRPDKSKQEKAHMTVPARPAVSDQNLNKSKTSKVPKKLIADDEENGGNIEKRSKLMEVSDKEDDEDDDEDEEEALQLLDVLAKKHGLEEGEGESVGKEERKKKKKEGTGKSLVLSEVKHAKGSKHKKRKLRSK